MTTITLFSIRTLASLHQAVVMSDFHFRLRISTIITSANSLSASILITTLLRINIFKIKIISSDIIDL